MNYYLFCVECPSTTNVFEHGWHVFLTDDKEEPPEVVVLCPMCAEREFGPPIRNTRTEEN